MKYKVGDRVTAQGSEFEGRVGEVVFLDETDDSCLVYWGKGFLGHSGYREQDNKNNWWHLMEEIALVSSDTAPSPYLSAINRAKAYQMHYKRVKRERDESRKDAEMWRERFDELYKKFGERSMQHELEMFDEQLNYAELAGKYAAATNTQDELLRDLRRWKIGCCVVVAAVVFMGLLVWVL